MAAYKKSMQTRKSILDATAHLVVEKGYAETSIKDIAEYLSVPRTLVYYYFKNKEDILHELYNERFFELEEIAAKVLRQGEQPLVRLMLKYILFRRRVAMTPLFTEFIILSPDYASFGSAVAAEKTALYYGDSYEAFRYMGRPTDDEDFRMYVLMIEAISRALIQGEYYKTIDFTERKFMECFAERTVMISLGLTHDEMGEVLDQAFALADSLEQD